MTAPTIPSCPCDLALPAAAGFFAQLGQILLFRELLANFHGSELVYAAILGIGLLGAALGSALVSAFFSQAAPATIARHCAWLSTISGPGLAGAIILARYLGACSDSAAKGLAAPGVMFPVILSVVLPGAILCGAQLGLLLRLSNAPVRLYRAEAVGAIAAGIVFTFFLQHAGPVLTALFAGMLLSVLALRQLQQRGLTIRLACLIGVGLTITAALLATERITEQLRWRALAPAYRLTAFADSPYGRITALTAANNTQVSFYQNGALCATLEPGRSDPTLEQMADLTACLHPAPHRALVLGDSLTPFTQLLAQRHDIDHIEVLTLDPVLLATARNAGALHSVAQSDPRVVYLTGDGRQYLRNVPPGTFDLIVLSPGEPDNAGVNRFCTVEFFTAARRAMNSTGVLVLQLPAFGAGGEYTAGPLARRTSAIFVALRTVFPDVQAAPVQGHLLIAGATEKSITLLPAALAQRFTARPAGRKLKVTGAVSGITANLSAEDYFSAMFGGVFAMRPTLDSENGQPGIKALLSALERAPMPANRDQNPTAIMQSIAAQSEITSRTQPTSDPCSDSISRLREASVWSLLLPLASAFLFLLYAQRHEKTARTPDDTADRHERTALFFCAAATGAFGMLTEIVLLNTYQNLRGCVYSEIGALTATFMAGLVAGTISATHNTSTIHTKTGMLLLLATATALSIPPLILLLNESGEFISITVLFGTMLWCGALTGAAYAALTTSRPARYDQSWSGTVYAADLAGGATGAMIGGAVWLPFVGLPSALCGLAGGLIGGYLLWRQSTYANQRPGISTRCKATKPHISMSDNDLQ